MGWGREAVTGQDSVLRVPPPCGASNGGELPGCVVLGSQEAPAQLPGAMATRSPAAGCDPPLSSRAVLLRLRRAKPGIPEGHHRQETGLQEPLRSPCRVPLFSVSALHSQAQVWEPEVSFQPELSTCLTCALGLCNHPAASVGLLLPEAPSLVSPKLQAPHLGQDRLTDAWPWAAVRLGRSRECGAGVSGSPPPPASGAAPSLAAGLCLVSSWLL